MCFLLKKFLIFFVWKKEELHKIKNRRNTFEPNYNDDYDLVNFDNNHKFLKIKTEFNDSP